MRKFIIAGMAVAMLAIIPAAASASVNVSDKGVGFVGKGDVQTAFVWNNKALQDNAKDVTFSYKTTDTYSAVCTWTTGEGTRGEQTHDVSHATSTAVNASIAYDARTRNQITGFNLTGFAGEPTETGTVPVAGEPCMGNEGHDGLWTSVTQTGSTGGLFVNWNGRSIAMPNTPPIITTVG